MDDERGREEAGKEDVTAAAGDAMRNMYTCAGRGCTRGAAVVRVLERGGVGGGELLAEPGIDSGFLKIAVDHELLEPV